MAANIHFIVENMGEQDTTLLAIVDCERLVGLKAKLQELDFEETGSSEDEMLFVGLRTMTTFFSSWIASSVARRFAIGAPQYESLFFFVTYRLSYEVVDRLFMYLNLNPPQYESK